MHLPKLKTAIGINIQAKVFIFLNPNFDETRVHHTIAESKHSTTKQRQPIHLHQKIPTSQHYIWSCVGMPRSYSCLFWKWIIQLMLGTSPCTRIPSNHI